MKRAVLVSVQTLFLALGSAPVVASGPDWSAVDGVFGTAGKELPGGAHRFGWPRSDLKVTIGATHLEPALALGSWGAFIRTGKGEEAMTMGDLVLLESELTPVVTALQSGGLDVVAIHNHLVREDPHVVYVHFSGHGDASSLARGLKGALERTKTPLAAAAKTELSADEAQAFKRLENALGRTGTMAGRVMQASVPRAGKIEEHGIEIPPSMGMSNSMNFQLVGEKVATTGDFVLVASEVNPVIRELRAGGFDVTALHSHMLEESPRLFFMHFWCVDTPERVGGTLKAALSKVNTRR
jgi:hypothetical protein